MKVYVQARNDRTETRYLSQQIAGALAGKFEITNPDLKTDFSKAEEADAVIVWNASNPHHDESWAVIGIARAGNRPVIPFWNSPSSYKTYGFQQDLEQRNKLLVRKQDDSRKWPVTSVEDLIEDVKILEQAEGWREKRIKKPGKDSVDLTKPPYLTGDSRDILHQMQFFLIEAALKANGIDIINPSRDIDNYNIGFYPRGLNLSGDAADNGVERCVQNAGERSSMIISSRGRYQANMGESFEHGVAWFHSKPNLILVQYVFNGKSGELTEAYKNGKNPGLYHESVFRQNQGLWGIETHDFRTPGEIAREICRLRGKEYKEPTQQQISEAFAGILQDLQTFSNNYSIPINTQEQK